MRSWVFGLVYLLEIATHSMAEPHKNTDWPRVGNDSGCMRYSPLTMIDRTNVARLKPVWTYHTGELEGRKGKTIECTPIVIDGMMYVTTGYLRVVALDATTGKEIWQFDPLKDHPFPHPTGLRRRQSGLRYWSDGKPGGERADHPRHVGRPTVLARREDGQARPEVRRRGIRNLRELSSDKDHASLSYGPTSAPAIWKDTIIVGVSCDEGPGIAAPGDIRAFNVRTGLQVWRFRTVPRPGEFGNDTWVGESWKERGGANAWGGISVDVERGMVFAGLGSASFDFYGGDRRGDNLFANCTIALDAQDRQTDLALSDVASRSLGPRLAGLSQSGQGRSRRQAD